MSIRIYTIIAIALGFSSLPSGSLLAQQSGVSAVSGSRVQTILEQSAQQGKYTFVLFYKQNDESTSAMNTVLQDSLANETNRSTATFVQVGDPAEQALVAKYDIARAPMPMTLVIAPNGAVTGMFAQRLNRESISGAFVTPTMMATMKSLQAGKLVFVTVHGAGKPLAPVAMKDLQSDPHFSTRMVSLAMYAADPKEAMFMGQMQLDPNLTDTKTVLLAPPGVLVGKFDATASKAEIAAVLANAGKCCDDPNCKHHQPATQAQGTQATRRK